MVWGPTSQSLSLIVVESMYFIFLLEDKRKPYFGHLMRRAGSLEKTMLLGKIEGKRRRRWQKMRWLDSFIDSMDMNLSKLQEIAEDREPGVM